VVHCQIRNSAWWGILLNKSKGSPTNFDVSPATSPGVREPLECQRSNDNCVALLNEHGTKATSSVLSTPFLKMAATEAQSVAKEQHCFPAFVTGV
jgi:hypothetical protein